MVKNIENQKQENLKINVIDYSSTRNQTGKFSEAEKINKEEIDFSSCEGHLQIHTEGEVAGSKFNGEVFNNPKEITDFIKKSLPNEVPFDDFGRCEVSFEVSAPIGQTGVMSLKEIQQEYNGEVSAGQKQRMPGGESGEYEGREGTWYPEGKFNPATKTFEILKNEDGSIKNPHGKFEPLANIAEVGRLPETHKITAIIEKDRNSGKPVMRTAFPGDNAPMYPSSFGESMQKDSQETIYWNEHTFLKLNEELALKEAAITETAEVKSLEKESSSEQIKLIEEISKRADSSSEKVKQRIQERFITNINQMGDRAEWWLNNLRNDFYSLVEDPDDESGGGQYKGWKPEEIKELYSVLYGEELDY